MSLNTWGIYPDINHPIKQTCCIQEYVDKASKYNRHLVIEPGEDADTIRGNAILLNKPINLHIIHPYSNRLILLHDAPIYVITSSIDMFHITKSIELIPGRWSTDSHRRMISFERVQ